MSRAKESSYFLPACHTGKLITDITLSAEISSVASTLSSNVQAAREVPSQEYELTSRILDPRVIHFVCACVSVEKYPGENTCAEWPHCALIKQMDRNG